MTTADPNTPDPAAPGTGQAAPGTGGQQVDWQAQAAEWQKRFTGLQGRFQQEQSKLAEAQGKVHDLTDTLTKLTGEKEALSLQFQQTNERHDTVSGELDVTKEALARLNVIITDYPDLLDFERQGLLPDGVGDELKNKLGQFKAALTARGAAAAQAQLQGATPPAPAVPPGAKSLEDTKAEAFKAMREGRVDDYNRLMDDYWKAKNSAK